MTNRWFTCRFSVSLPLILLSSGTAQGSALTHPEHLPRDFAGIYGRVCEVALSLKRAQAVLEGAAHNSASVGLQSRPNLLWSNSFSFQESQKSAFKQLHSLSLSTTLWDFGRQAAQEMRAQAQLQVAQAQTAEQQEVLKARTARYYVALATAENLHALAQEQMRTAASKLQTVTAGYRRGERPLTDVARLKVELGKAELFVSRASDEFASLAAQLQLLLRPDSGLSGSAAEELRLRLEPLTERNRDQWQSLLKGWQNQNVESAFLEKWMANEKVLRADLENLSAESGPVVAGNVGTQSSGNFLPLKQDVLAQLTLQVTFPLSSIRSEKRSALLAKLNEVRFSFEEEKKNRLDKLAQNRVRLDGLLRTMDLQKKQIASVLEYQKLVRERYFAGRASLLELTTTEDELLANRVEWARLQSNAYLAAIEAADALGGNEIEKLF
jgi:outer membrane protein TolC